MLHDHNLANNLFVRLAITKPHPKHSPLENFCTEALVGCLRNSMQFRKRFVDLCTTRLSIQRPSGEPEISTQVVPLKVQLTNVRGSSSVPVKRAQFDIELRFLLPKGLRIVIESKVDSPVKAEQLQGYCDLLEQTNDPKGHLLLLVSSAKRIPGNAPAVRKILWEEIYERALAGSRDRYPKGEKRPAELFLREQFSQFLHSEGLSPVSIPKLSSSQLSAFPDTMRFLGAFEQLLLKLKSSGELKAPHQKPTMSVDEARHLTWYGLQLAESAYTGGWVGIEFNHQIDAVSLLFSATVPKGTTTTLGVKFPGRCKFIPVENETWLEVQQPLESHYNGNEKEITRWIKDAAEAMKEFAKQRRRKIA